jgi:hypothetical protein
MANMECLRANYFNTTTMVTVDTGTSGALYLFDRKSDQLYTSSGDNSDSTTCTIRVEFATAKNIDKIVLQNINWKGFRIYYNSNTANLITLDSTCPTTSTQWNQNSATSLYLNLANTLSASIITFEITTTMSSNAEKSCGEMWITEKMLRFVHNPTARQYKVSYDRMEYTHTMSDGGTVVYFVQDNFKADIQRQYVDSTEYDSLRDLHTLVTPFAFVPFPTGTAWDGKIYEVNWIGDFDFESYSENVTTAGYSGTMRLRETPK